MTLKCSIGLAAPMGERVRNVTIRIEADTIGLTVYDCIGQLTHCVQWNSTTSHKHYGPFSLYYGGWCLYWLCHNVYDLYGHRIHFSIECTHDVNYGRLDIVNKSSILHIIYVANIWHTHLPSHFLSIIYLLFVSFWNIESSIDVYTVYLQFYI